MKKILSIALAVWLCGAFVMTVVYELRQKGNCIREEGFLKGFFVCDKQPANPANYLGQQTDFMFRSFAWPYFLFSTTLEKSSATQRGSWGVLETGTPFTIGTGTSSAPEESVKTLLLVYFNPKNSCRPELSFLVVVDGNLGEPVVQDKTSTHIQVSIGKRLLKNYPTVFTTYTSGAEYAMPLEDELYTEMNGSKSILIAPNNMKKSRAFPLNGFTALATAQLSACKKS